MRVLNPELLHVTLCFLGDRPVEEVATIGVVLDECAVSVGELSIGAPLWLPPRRPRALAVEVRDDPDDPDGGLAALHGVLTEALARTCGYQAERRRFRAHVTVARVREGPRRSKAQSPDGWAGRVLAATPALSFTPASVVLYRSWLSPAGASYEALATRTLVPS